MEEKNIITLHAGNATMRIVPEKFFPAKQADMKKLIKFIKLADFEESLKYQDLIIKVLKVLMSNNLRLREHFRVYKVDPPEEADQIMKWFVQRSNMLADSAILKINQRIKALERNLDYMEDSE